MSEDDRVRILYVALKGDLNGGSQVQYRHLIESLSRSRYEPRVIFPAPGDGRDALARAGVACEVVPYPIWSRGEVLRWGAGLWSQRARASHRLVALAARRPPHIVHGDFFVAPYVAAIARALRIPAVLHIRNRVKPRWVSQVRRCAPATLIAIGDGHRDQLVGFGVPADRIAVIADATDLARFRPRPGSRLREEDPSIAPDEVVFGIVGRIEPFKRQLDYLRAARQMLASGRRARFFVVGAEQRSRFVYVRRVRAFAASHGLRGAVTFTGLRRDMPEVIASLDVLVTLSGGSVMLEAMACGVPVITATNRAPSSLRIVRDGESGRVVPAQDAEALVRAMCELCDDATERQRLGVNGRRRAEALFGRERMVEETTRLYESLLAAGSH